MREKIGVFFGGNSWEHEISIITAMQVIKALDKSKYEVLLLYMTKDNKIYYGKYLENQNNYLDIDRLKKECTKVVLKYNNDETYIISDELKYIKKKIDLIIPIFHGKGVEDGNISALLSSLNIPYTTSYLTSASLCQDKVFSKMILNENHFNVLDYEFYYKDDFDVSKVNLEYPIIVKPATLGSSIGINIAKDEDELENFVELAFCYDDKILLESALTRFQEFNCSALKCNNEIVCSNIEEVIKSDEILSYKDKYENGSMECVKRILPAKINNELEEVIKETTKAAYRLLECRGVVRIDYLYDLKTKKLFLNEINTIPGSLAFYLWEDKDIRFDRLLDLMMDQARLDFQEEKRKITNYDNMKILKNIRFNKWFYKI